MKRIEHDDPRIIHLNFATQYDLTSSFVRIQEFYESPYEGIRGQFFTLEQFMDKYAEHTGNFTYFSDWGGFNVPGNVVYSFWNVFDPPFYSELREKERVVLDVVKPFLLGKSDKNFYLIGTYGPIEGEGAIYVDHEVAHAYYYLSQDYKAKQDAVTATLDSEVKAKAAVKLLEMGYTESVIDDEIQAYFSTDAADVLSARFGLTKEQADVRRRYRDNFMLVRPAPKEKALT